MSHCGTMHHEFPPGSLAARKRGCRCPVLDNEFGAGYMGAKDTYVTSDQCNLHWDAEPTESTPPVRACAGCGSAASDVEDVSLLVGSGADETRRLVWEHPFCEMCLRTLLCQFIERYCRPAGCNETHDEP